MNVSMYSTSDGSSRSAKRKKCNFSIVNRLIFWKIYLVRLMCIDLTSNIDQNNEENPPNKYE